MNERIKELINQCTSYSDGSTWTSREEFDYKKFAKLIVRKCVETIQNESMNSNDEWEDGLVIAQQAIKEHFGVEE